MKAEKDAASKHLDLAHDNEASIVPIVIITFQWPHSQKPRQMVGSRV